VFGEATAPNGYVFFYLFSFRAILYMISYPFQEILVNFLFLKEKKRKIMKFHSKPGLMLSKRNLTVYMYCEILLFFVFS
jgi:hypothetical protein